MTMRRRGTYTVALLALLLSPAAVARAESWRGITPLKSTRADVERLFGRPSEEYRRYEFPEETASVRYAAGNQCDDPNDCWCVAPKDVVTNIEVSVSVEMKFSGLKLDLREYEKFTSPAPPHHTTYTNEKRGITYTVSEDGEVLSINYYPSESDCREMVRRRGGEKIRAFLRPASTHDVNKARAGETVLMSRNILLGAGPSGRSQTQRPHRKAPLATSGCRNALFARYTLRRFHVDWLLIKD